MRVNNPASIDFVLDRVDEWSSKLIDENYTQAKAHEIMREALIDLEENPYREIASKCLPRFSRDNVMKEFTEFFGNSYSSLDAMNSHKPKLRSKNMKTYLNYGIVAGKKMVKFAKTIKKRADDIFPRDLDDLRIGRTFIDVFGDSRGFAEVVIGLENLINVLGSRTVSISEFARINVETKFYGTHLPKITKAIFRDLE